MSCAGARTRRVVEFNNNGDTMLEAYFVSHLQVWSFYQDHALVPCEILASTTLDDTSSYLEVHVMVICMHSGVLMKDSNQYPPGMWAVQRRLRIGWSVCVPLATSSADPGLRRINPERRLCLRRN